MLDAIALPLIAPVIVIIASAVVIAYRWRRRRAQWRLLRDLNPMSEHWLADHRRR